LLTKVHYPLTRCAGAPYIKNRKGVCDYVQQNHFGLLGFLALDYAVGRLSQFLQTEA
jgi:hypothetical protein